jgi:hypothetical protein
MDGQTPDEEEEPRVGFRAFITDLRNMDQLILVVAAIMTFCAFAFFFMPAMGPTITKVFEDITRQQEAEAARLKAEEIKARVDSGVMDMTLFPTTPATPKTPTPPAKKN